MMRQKVVAVNFGRAQEPFFVSLYQYLLQEAEEKKEIRKVVLEEELQELKKVQKEKEEEEEVEEENKIAY